VPFFTFPSLLFFFSGWWFILIWQGIFFPQWGENFVIFGFVTLPGLFPMNLVFSVWTEEGLILKSPFTIFFLFF